jgi:hypothetical protein
LGEKKGRAGLIALSNWSISDPRFLDQRSLIFVSAVHDFWITDPWFLDHRSMIFRISDPWVSDQWSMIFESAILDFRISDPWFPDQRSMIFESEIMDFRISDPWFSDQSSLIFGSAIHDFRISDPWFLDQSSFIFGSAILEFQISHLWFTERKEKIEERLGNCQIVALEQSINRKKAMCPDLFIMHNRFGKISTRIHEKIMQTYVQMANICGKVQKICKKWQKQVFQKEAYQGKDDSYSRLFRENYLLYWIWGYSR